MPHDVAISRAVLSDQVKDRLLAGILEGRYAPGSRIVETRVAREFGTSQAPVREALRDLEALGVVEIAAFKGARVRRPTTDELLEAFAVRASLEGLGARLAIPRLQARDLATIGDHLGEMRRAADAGDAHAEALADARFHGRIVELSGNATLLGVWERLEPFSRTYITIVTSGFDRHGVADSHVPILDALAARDPLLAEAAIERHFADARVTLAQLWPTTAARGVPDAPVASHSRPRQEPARHVRSTRVSGPVATPASSAP